MPGGQSGGKRANSKRNGKVNCKEKDTNSKVAKVNKSNCNDLNEVAEEQLEINAYAEQSRKENSRKRRSSGQLEQKKIKRSTKSQERDIIPSQEMEQNRKSASKPENMTVTEDDLEITYVRGNETYAQSEYSDGEEDLDRSSENEIGPNRSRSRNRSKETPVKQGRQEQAEQARKQIKDIDEEMASKLNELREMMAKGGYSKSLKVVDQCLNLNQDKSDENETSSGKTGI